MRLYLNSSPGILSEKPEGAATFACAQRRIKKLAANEEIKKSASFRQKKKLTAASPEEAGKKGCT
jgi:hypothetical protein